MPVALTREALARLFPRARSEVREAIYAAQTGILARFEISKTPKRLSYFLAQCAEESGGWTAFEERLSYSAERIRQVWPSRPEAVRYARNPRGLANSVYASRMGNGNAASGDGWKYRGRGPIQLTGKANYREIGALLGLDLVGNPDLVMEPGNLIACAAAYWHRGNCNRFADRGDFIGLTRAINGGLTNLALRQEWLRKVEAEMARPGSVRDVTAAVTPFPAPTENGGSPTPPPPDIEPPPARPEPSWAARAADAIIAFFRRIFGAR